MLQLLTASSTHMRFATLEILHIFACKGWIRVSCGPQIYWIYLLYFLGLLERCWKPPAGRAVFNVPLFTGWCASFVLRAQI